MFNIIHFNDPYKEVDIGLDGRDEELCKPLLQLFYTLVASLKTLNEIEETLQQHFLSLKNNRKENSLEAVIFPIIVNAISVYGKEIQTYQIWRLITQGLEGDFADNNPNVFHSAEHGQLYRNKITSLIEDKFGADKKHCRNGDTLISNSNYIEKIGKIYDKSRSIKTRTVCEPCETRETSTGNIPSLEAPNVDNNGSNNAGFSTNLTENHYKLYEIEPKRQTNLSLNVSHASRDSKEYPAKCYRCDFSPDNKKQYEDHCFQRHSGYSAYPNKASIKSFGLEPQGMDWER
jgi:hypothetical protein